MEPMLEDNIVMSEQRHLEAQQAREQMINDASMIFSNQDLNLKEL